MSERPPLSLISEETILNAFEAGEVYFSGDIITLVRSPVNFPMQKRYVSLCNKGLLIKDTAKKGVRNANTYAITDSGVERMKLSAHLVQPFDEYEHWQPSTAPVKTRQAPTKDLFSMDSLGLSALPLVIEETGQMTTFLTRLKGQLEDFIDVEEEEEAEDE